MRNMAMRATEVMENKRVPASKVDRRQFLVTAALTGGALLLKGTVHPEEALASAGSVAVAGIVSFASGTFGYS